MKMRAGVLTVAVAALLTGCTPRIEVAAPSMFSHCCICVAFCQSHEADYRKEHSPVTAL